jgi:hypothetical protein
MHDDAMEVARTIRRLLRRGHPWLRGQLLAIHVLPEAVLLALGRPYGEAPDYDHQVGVRALGLAFSAAWETAGDYLE